MAAPASCRCGCTGVGCVLRTIGGRDARANGLAADTQVRADGKREFFGAIPIALITTLIN